ncbi:MAG: nucleotidyltransferase domain-containing protein [Labilithrix sp.]|nr:nucleotidyltransferase domain-containing protein [Labilithrix sp.]MCW5836211.1 nucleotidyltransferase domain-containing protein [Labilithrix sp.]
MSAGLTHPMFLALPSTVRDRITEWTKSLEAALGDDLVAILLTGGVARGDFRPGESDVNALIVLHDASFEKLDAISSAMQAARYGARVEPTILTQDELPGACDAFPLLYDEITKWNLILVGEDPFVDAVVHDTHRRLRIEQELREAQIGLRRVVTDALGAREAIGGAVGRKIRQVRRPLRALLVLKAIACKEDLASVLACAGEAYGVDVASLAAPREAPEAAHGALTKLLAAAIADVKAMERDL